MFTKINPESLAEPVSAFSHGVIIPASADIVVTSGTLGVTKDGQLAEGFDEQCHQVWRNIEAILKESDCTLDSIVRVNGFLKNRGDAGRFREIRDLYLPLKPASTVVIAELIDPEWLIEIEVIAARIPADPPFQLNEGGR